MADSKAPRRGMYRLRKPDGSALAELLISQSGHELSYRTIGSTLRQDGPPPGLHQLRVSRTIGHGAERFDAAKAAIIDWAGHRRAGATLNPARPSLEVGSEVSLALRVWPLWVTAACRIVEVIDEPDRFGFAYGTLPHHPARGEEVFLVARDPATDEVHLEVMAHSKPASALVKLSGPFGRVIQRFAAGRYLDGFADPSPTNDRSETPSPSRPPPPFNLFSVRWWFENRITGELTIAQSPNWPLVAIVGLLLARWVADPSDGIRSFVGYVFSALWVYWGSDEVIRGVNPWRKALGLALIGVQIFRILA